MMTVQRPEPLYPLRTSRGEVRRVRRWRRRRLAPQETTYPRGCGGQVGIAYAITVRSGCWPRRGSIARSANLVTPAIATTGHGSRFDAWAPVGSCVDLGEAANRAHAVHQRTASGPRTGPIGSVRGPGGKRPQTRLAPQRTASSPRAGPVGSAHAPGGKRPQTRLGPPTDRIGSSYEAPLGPCMKMGGASTDTTESIKGPQRVHAWATSGPRMDLAEASTGTTRSTTGPRRLHE
jgi:hypothetical protein